MHKKKCANSDNTEEVTKRSEYTEKQEYTEVKY
jgi:hypothetical protein